MINNITLQQLIYALAVEREKNFSQAAISCGVGQPTLSEQLLKLEDQLQVKIFDRSKRPILTTDEGKKILKHAREVMKIMEMIHQAGKKPTVFEGELRIGVIPTVSTYLIPPLLNRVTKKYPQLKLLLIEMTTENIMRDLKKDQLDAGILATPLKENFVERVLFYEPFDLYLPPKHPLLQYQKISLAQLPKNDLIFLDEGHCLRDQVLKLCHLKSPEKKWNSLFLGNLGTLIELVDQGIGATFLPRFCTKQATPARIRPLASGRREISLVTDRVFYKEREIEALGEIIKDLFAKP